MQYRHDLVLEHAVVDKRLNPTSSETALALKSTLLSSGNLDILLEEMENDDGI